jgi:ComF family protein
MMPALSGAGGCARCGDLVDASAQAGLCRACRLAPPPFARAVAYGLYRGRLKDAIHALKYDRLYPAARELGRMLAVTISQLAPEMPEGLLVIPVPLHKSKQAHRGFNQARALAVQARACLRKSHPHWRLALEPNALLRVRPTESQAGLTPRQRRLNVRAAFSVADRARVAGKNALVIDDIMTTGATARAAALALKRSGAANVFVATLARARREGYAAYEIVERDAEDGTSFQDGMAAIGPAGLSGAQEFSASHVS